jgi:DNA-binding transcriptional ArsR family regulator
MATSQNPMPPELLEMVAERFKALAEPTRLSLLDTLRRGEHTVSELAEITELHPANVSKHLQYLHQTGFVSRRKEGLYVHYSLSDERVNTLCDMMCGKIQEEAEARRKVFES